MDKNNVTLELQKMRLDLDSLTENEKKHYLDLTNKTMELERKVDHRYEELLEALKLSNTHLESFIAQMKPMAEFFNASGMLKRGFISFISVIATILAIGYGIVQFLSAIFKIK